MADLRYVVVGGGLAGAKAVEGLRDSGATGPVTVLAAEPDAPYERPPLTKEFLKGEKEYDTFRALAEDWYGQHDVEVRLRTRATAIDRGKRTVALEDGSELGYDRLLIATGADPLPAGRTRRRPARLHYLRRSPTRARLSRRSARRPPGRHRRRRLDRAGGRGRGPRARQRGHRDRDAANAAARALGAELGGFFAELHREHGVDLRIGAGVAAFRGAGGVSTVVTRRRRRAAPRDVVVVGVGVRPNVELAEEAGLDGRQRHPRRRSPAARPTRASTPPATSPTRTTPARPPHLRVEHWANALQRRARPRPEHARPGRGLRPGPVLLHRPVRPRHGVLRLRAPAATTRSCSAATSAGREFIAFWLPAAGSLAGMNVNVWDVTDPIQALCAPGKPVDLARLADPAVALTDLL